MLVFAFVPGLPMFQFFFLAVLLATVAFLIERRTANTEAQLKADVAQTERDKAEAESNSVKSSADVGRMV